MSWWSAVVTPTAVLYAHSNVDGIVLNIAFPSSNSGTRHAYSTIGRLNFCNYVYFCVPHYIFALMYYKLHVFTLITCIINYKFSYKLKYREPLATATYFIRSLITNIWLIMSPYVHHTTTHNKFFNFKYSIYIPSHTHTHTILL